MGKTGHGCLKEGGKAFDIRRMAQNMMVAAKGLGLTSCPVTFHNEDCVRELLGFPDDHEAPMGVGLGHPAPRKEERESSPGSPSMSWSTGAAGRRERGSGPRRRPGAGQQLQRAQPDVEAMGHGGHHQLIGPGRRDKTIQLR